MFTLQIWRLSTTIQELPALFQAADWFLIHITALIFCFSYKSTLMSFRKRRKKKNVAWASRPSDHIVTNSKAPSPHCKDQLKSKSQKCLQNDSMSWLWKNLYTDISIHITDFPSTESHNTSFNKKYQILLSLYSLKFEWIRFSSLESSSWKDFYYSVGFSGN